MNEPLAARIALDLLGPGCDPADPECHSNILETVAAFRAAYAPTQREVLTALERDNPQVVGKRSAL